MSATFVRCFYQVPAKRGMRVTVDGKPGQIVGFAGPYLRVRFDGEKHPVNAHPTWRVEYGTFAAQRHEARCDYCGRYMSWARWSSWNCFAGYPKAWCERYACNFAAAADGAR